MIHLYIQTNILIAAAWIVFQLLPKGRLGFRANKTLAQLSLSAALILSPILFSMPDVSFPKLTSPVEMIDGMDVDAGSAAITPIRNVIHEVGDAVTPSAPISRSLPAVGLWLFAIGMAVMCARRV